ncbi:MAG: adenine phosphoribosyltransferase [Oscillospiraceae bacterium]|nr:adenine phosphoribosyltransferase [Oscillospiraceae bacterium]MBR2805981.1 adenine phosphoribosyltransferase [Oscillospiraceae bacterium]
MSNFYEMTIAGCKRQLPLCEVNEHLDIAGFIMFGDVEITVKAAEELLKKIDFEFDYILTAEAKGIPLAYELARQSGKEYIVGRKGPKLYMKNPVKLEIVSITTDHVQTLYLDQTDLDKMKGKNVLIADDVISTGGSLKTLEEMVKLAEGNLAGKVTVLAEGEAAQRKDIVFLEELPVFPK